MKKFFFENGLSITFFVLFLVGITGQIVFGIQEYNKIWKIGATTRLGWVNI